MARMLINKNLNYKKKLGDQKCIFGLQTRSLREGGGKRKEKKRKKKKRKEGRKSKVWMLAFGMELVIFIWNYMALYGFLSNCMVRSLLQT